VTAPDLDAWLPDPQIRSRGSLPSTADPEQLWRAAREVRLKETRTLGRLIRWRIPGTPADLTFEQLFARYPFTVLDQGPSWSLSGMCGKIWTFTRDYPRIENPAQFRAWNRPGTVRVLFGHWVEQVDGGSVLHSEARVAPTDRFARLQLRGLWLIVSRFERVISAEPLPLAIARAEGSAQKPGQRDDDVLQEEQPPDEHVEAGEDGSVARIGAPRRDEQRDEGGDVRRGEERGRPAVQEQRRGDDDAEVRGGEQRDTGP
jgi:hypothetical protein